MNILYLLIPVTICMGLVALATFIWSLRTRQYEDLSGAAERVLLSDENEPIAGPQGQRPHGQRPRSAAPHHAIEEAS